MIYYAGSLRDWSGIDKDIKDLRLVCFALFDLVDTDITTSDNKISYKARDGGGWV